ncbi:MAG: hypothetical protein MI723_09805, partial [Caulobacterales bacterium]|nr:hypothetical protein [Caulobacterales bacterium]
VLDGEDAAGARKSYRVDATGSTGSVRLADVTTDAQGRQCKEIEEVYTPAAGVAGGEPISESYTMCQRSDGTWANVS